LLIVRKLPLSDFARVLAFGTLCFLPRHIYMGALHSNDTLAHLFVAVCIYLLLRIIEGKAGLRTLTLLSLAVSAAIFTKYTTFGIIPVIALTFALLKLRGESAVQIGQKALLVLLLPSLLLASYMLRNNQRYGAALPINTSLYDPSTDQPSDPGGADFASFAPWRFVDKPILWPGQVSSFWTILHSGFWFDTEPQFVCQLKSENKDWWRKYFDWQTGKATRPPPYDKGDRFVRSTGSLMIAVGLVPLFLGILGFGRLLVKVKDAIRSRDWSEALPLQALALLFALNMAVVIHLAVRIPVYSAMKASYLLASLPALAVLLALGIMTLEKRRSFRLACGGFFAAQFLLVIANTLTMVLRIP
jgi:4-amino-4-deoxy-L-arabinose transferase-like glycosyltransferase